MPYARHATISQHPAVVMVSKQSSKSKQAFVISLDGTTSRLKLDYSHPAAWLSNMHKRLVADAWLAEQEIRSFRNAFEQLLASLANHDNDEANSLMVSALETVEMMNNALQLKEEVGHPMSSPSPNHAHTCAHS